MRAPFTGIASKMTSKTEAGAARSVGKLALFGKKQRDPGSD
jgi:hypothetical protein